MDSEILAIINTIAQAGLFLATVGLVYVAYWQVNKVRDVWRGARYKKEKGASL